MKLIDYTNWCARRHDDKDIKYFNNETMLPRYQNITEDEDGDGDQRRLVTKEEVD